VRAARFDHVFLVTSDVAAMRHLLVDVFGLELLADEEGYVRIGGGDGFHVGIEEGDPGPPNATELVIAVDDVDAVYRRAAAEGVPFEGPPVDTEWRARHAWFTDPDGRRMSIFSASASSGA